MSISQVNNSAASMPEVVDFGSNSEMDKDAFLKLLTVQLANQDPLNPMDSNTMATQQVAFAELEQLINLNETMTTFVKSQKDVLFGIAGVFNTLESANFLGREVAFSTDMVYVDSQANVESLFYDLTQDAFVGYTVRDKNGLVVKAVGSQAVDSGTGIATGWDGTDASGNAVAPGFYTVELDVLDAKGQSMKGSSYSHVKVASVDFREGTPMLTLADGRKISVTEVLALIEPSEDV